MRVAAVTGFPPDPYGEAHHSWEVFTSLARQYRDVEVLVLAHRRTDAPTELAVTPNLTVRRVTEPGGGRLRSAVATWRLFRHIRRFGADVVHFQGAHTAKYGGIFGEPVALLILLLRIVGVPSVFTLHGLWMPTDLDRLWQEKGLSAGTRRVINWYFGANMRAIARSVAILNVLSSTTTSQLPDLFMNAYALRPRIFRREVHPCRRVPLSDEERCVAKEALHVAGKQLIIAAGFVRRDKGFHVLLERADELLDELPNASIIIAGEALRPLDREYGEELLQKRSDLRNRDRVVVDVRHIPDEEFKRLFDAADIVVVPYLLGLGASGPLHHGLGRGLPVVASDLPLMEGFASICRIVPVNDAEALQRAVVELLTNPGEYARYARAALEYASGHTWDDLARQYLDEFREACGGSAAGEGLRA
jgi:glycosyltransferase involved in cell wall biosynthesis